MGNNIFYPYKKIKVAILVTPHSEQEEKVLLAFLDSLDYEYHSQPGLGKPQTIEEYNREIENAVAEIESGKFITQEELEKEMQLW